jgi:hypothetical protein
LKHPSRAGHEDAWCKRLTPEVVDGCDLRGADGSGVYPDFIDEAAVELVSKRILAHPAGSVRGDSFLRREGQERRLQSTVGINPASCAGYCQARVLPDPRLKHPCIDASRRCPCCACRTACLTDNTCSTIPDFYGDIARGHFPADLDITGIRPRVQGNQPGVLPRHAVWIIPQTDGGGRPYRDLWDGEKLPQGVGNRGHEPPRLCKDHSVT